MRWLKIIGGLLAVLVLLAAGGLVYLATLDAEEFRQPIATAVKDFTGRDFKIAGAMELDISLQPRIVANDLSLGNAKWGSRPEMVKIKRFEVVVRLLPLLSGQVSIVRINLVEADILLESNKQGRGNWQFESKGADKKAEASGGGPAQIPTIDEIQITNSTLVYKDGVSGKSHTIVLQAITGTAKSANEPIGFNAALIVNGTQIDASGKIGPLGNLAGGGKVEIDIAVAAMGMKITAKGAAEGARGNADVTVAADNLSGLKAILGDAVPANLPLKLTAKVAASADAIAIRGLRLNFGRSDLAGTVDIALKGKRPAIVAKLSGKKLDLAQLLPAAGKAKKKTGKAAKRVFPSDPLPLAGLRALDVKLELKLAEVVTPILPLRDVALAVVLKAGRLSLDRVALLVAGSKVTANAVVDASKKVPRVNLVANAPKLDLGRLLKETGTSDMLEGVANFGLKLSGSGKSVAAIMASLNGNTRLLMNQGRMRTKAFDLAVGGLAAVMGGLFSDQKEWTVLNCAVGQFDIAKGVAVAKVLLVDAEYSTVRGEGKINLGKEKLALKITPESKSATLNLAIPIKVGGSFMEPTFRPDELAAATKIGGLLAATVFPPAALLSLADMGSGEDHPCLKLAANAGKSSPQTSSKSSSTIDKAADAAKSVIGSVTKGLKGLFSKD